MYLRKRNSLALASGIAITGILFWVLFSSFDQKLVGLAREYNQSASPLHRFLELIDPLMELLSHGSTLLFCSVVLFLIGSLLRVKLAVVGKKLIQGFFFSGVAAQILKHLCGRARPRVTDDTVFVGLSLRDSYHSFPSGHTSVAFCFASILSHYFPGLRALWYLSAAFVGFERIEDLKHFPSDVLAGALLGVLVAKLLLTTRRETKPLKLDCFDSSNIVFLLVSSALLISGLI